MASRHRYHTIFSSLSDMLHFRHPLFPSTPLNSPQTSDRVHNYDGLEANLAHRLTRLTPGEGAAFLSVATSQVAMDVLLDTLSDLRALLPQLKLSLTLSHHDVIKGFVSSSGNLLDECNAVREGVLEVQRWQRVVGVVLRLLGGGEGHAIEARIRRSWKLLGSLLQSMGEERESGASEQSIQHRSLRRWLYDSAESHEPQRWSSWHGTSTQARPQGVTFVGFPQYIDTDMEDCFTASLYSFHVITTFFLGTLMAGLPCKTKSLTFSASHPRHFLWALPLLKLQDRALNEMRKRGAGIGSGLLWELHQISTHVRRLFEFTGKALEEKALPLSAELEEEMKQIVVPLSVDAMELEIGLAPFYQQLTDFFHCLVAAHMELLDILRCETAGLR